MATLILLVFALFLTLHCPVTRSIEGQSFDFTASEVLLSTATLIVSPTDTQEAFVSTTIGANITTVTKEATFTPTKSSHAGATVSPQATQGATTSPTATQGVNTASVQGPTASVQGPTAGVQGPTASVQGPTASVQGPTASVQGHTASVQGPTASLQGPTSSSTATQETNTPSVQGPTASPNGPPNGGGSQQGASTSISAATTTGSVVTPTVTPSVVITCGVEIDPIWRLLWPKTNHNSFAIRPCPPQFYGIAKRWCNFLGLWGQPNLSNCHSENINGIYSQANSFFRDQPDISGAFYLAAQLRNISKPRNGMRLLPDDLSFLNDILKDTLSFLKQKGGPGSDQGSDIFDTFNNALDLENRESWLELQDTDSAVSEELLSNVEDYALYCALTINSTSETTLFSRSNIALRAKKFSRSDGEFLNNIFPSESDLVNSSNPDITNSIIIPGAYLEARANDENADGEVSVVNMLFSSLQDFLPEQNNESMISSVIISSQVITGNDNTTSGNNTIESVLLDLPIELTFAIDLSNVTYNASIEQLVFSCVSWLYSTDFNDTSTGGWVTDGIITSQDTVNDSVIHCYSSHLTSFAVLVSVVDNTVINSTDPTGIEEQLLSIVSYIGCSISIVCLLITITCLLTLKKELIQKPLNLLHLNLSIALLVGLVLFVSGIETAVPIPELCTTITVLMHYFFLAAFSWMFCEAIMLYLLVVIVFSRLIEKWWLYLLIGWGTPLVPLVITLASRFNEYRSDTLCWLSPEHGIIWSFVGPIIGVICVNTVILVVVLIRIGQSLYSKKRRQTVTKKDSETIKKSHHQSTALNIIKGMILLLPLLGSTWIIGIFAVNENTTVFAWLFVILNSLQGAFIFFFHVFKGPLVWGRFKKWHERNKREKETSTILKRELTTSGITTSEELEITKF